MSEKKTIVIAGGVAGGASAAARLRRLDEKAEIIVFERGEYISFANCGLPYHIAGTIKERERLLVQTPEKMKAQFNIDVRIRSEVTRIDRATKEVVVRDLASGGEYRQRYDYAVLSPGAEPFRPPIAGIDLPGVCTLRNMADMDAIIGRLKDGQAKHAVVVGGGYIGLEMAEALVERGLKVTLVELGAQVMATVDPEMAAPLLTELELHGVDVKLNTSVTEIRQGQRLTVLTNTQDSLETDLVIMSVGVRPENGLAKEAGLVIGSTGGIAVDEHMRTSDPFIYAAGDAVEVTDFVSGRQTLIPLAGPANRQGRIAADNICGRSSSYRNTQGTAICKVFGLSVGTTGQNEKALKRAGAEYQKIYVHPNNHAGYYPDAVPISLKLLFHPKTGKIFGAQAVGADGVDKRIDVLAVALRAGLTVHELEDLELTYAPPYGSAKDPVNYAGFVASNVIKGDARACHFDDLDGADKVLVDVRTEAEARAGTIPGAIIIPLHELRTRMTELPRDKELIIFCQVGLRGYLACRILSQNGYNCKNLCGGYKTWLAGNHVRPQKVNLPVMKEETAMIPTKEAVTAQIKIDACGLQCPGPIMKLKEAVEKLQPGQAVQITTTDPGFTADIKGWCQSTGSTLHSITPAKGRYEAVVVKGSACRAMAAAPASKDKTLVVFSGDFDKAMASFIIANGAAAMGGQVTMFFTFWGLNLLRKAEFVNVKKTPVEKMFGWMMPRGAERTSLSKMNMAGLGTRMIKGIMKNKNVTPLSGLIESARASGVKLVACSMSMDLMGIKREELIDGVEEGGVAMYLSQAEAAGVNLFI
jgi:NADPH-dependent 2,4-dienoyl-CoA reductase/sulfur reductase-like enzyme/peroxiredoxin family protein/TusA-related sulfurtransferase/rhodanese-related sulfurtransferase